MVLRSAVCVLAAAWCVGGAAARRNAGQVRQSAEPSGAELYQENCAVCHGDDLKGAQAPFPAPYRQPPDLTTLARRHDRKFPSAYVSNVLRNGVKLPAHGPAEMPVWGEEFKAKGHLSAKQVNARIARLTSYLASRQAK